MMKILMFNQVHLKKQNSRPYNGTIYVVPEHLDVAAALFTISKCQPS